MICRCFRIFCWGKRAKFYCRKSNSWKRKRTIGSEKLDTKSWLKNLLSNLTRALIFSIAPKTGTKILSNIFRLKMFQIPHLKIPPKAQIMEMAYKLTRINQIKIMKIVLTSPALKNLKKPQSQQFLIKQKLTGHCLKMLGMQLIFLKSRIKTPIFSPS